MKITEIKSQWSEAQGCSIKRENIGNQYIFIHFLTDAVLHTLNGDIAVRPGACIIYDKYSYQHFSVPDNPLLHDWFHLQGDISDKAKKYRLNFNQVYYPANSFAITEIVSGIEREFCQENEFSEDYYEIKITELMLSLSRNTLYSSKKTIDLKTRATLEYVRKTVFENYNKEWTVESMAKLANMSRSAFYNIYKQLFGLSPKQDLISCRIQHAKFMLIQGEYTVEQISDYCGYTNPFHFIRQFKAQTGITPGKYQL